MRTIIDSDRGLTYHLLCGAVAFGLIMGAGIIPMLYFFGWIAGLLFTMLMSVIWIDLAIILALIVYYTGVFIAASVAMFIWEPTVMLVDSTFQAISGAYTNATSYVSSFWTPVAGVR